MKIIPSGTMVFCALCVTAFAVQSVSAEDKYALKAPNGVPFADFKGYENWTTVNLSVTEMGLKQIAANDIMIKAYRSGIPGNGKPFPEGSKIVKIQWTKKDNPEAPFAVQVTDKQQFVEFIEKDSKKYAGTHGWGYAEFIYDPAKDSFNTEGDDAQRVVNGACNTCHEIVAGKDFIFTSYAHR